MCACMHDVHVYVRPYVCIGENTHYYHNSQSINQSIKIYIAPLQDTYSEALPTQANRKKTVFRRWWN